MQYVGRAIGSVSKTWNSINPATLSGAIDVIVVEQENGDLSCSPFHIRFGKFSLLRPSQKKVDFAVNGNKTDLPMKLGEGGEAFFVFETEGSVPKALITSPVVSPSSSPAESPGTPESLAGGLQEPEFLDLAQNGRSESFDESTSTSPDKTFLLKEASTFPARSTPDLDKRKSWDASSALSKEEAIERVKKLTKRLTDVNIPSKISDNGDIILDINGYKSDENDFKETEEVVKNILAKELGLDFDIETGLDSDGSLRIFSKDEGRFLFDHYDDYSAEGVPIPNGITKHQFDSDTALATSPSSSPGLSNSSDDEAEEEGSHHVKTLRLTSEQLKSLNLHPGRNDVSFSVNQGKATCTAKMFYWSYKDPIVISDIDGTITKSDALGHVLTMLGRDWTHSGVAKLFTDIRNNGYNIMYLTARSVGQADSTRYYLKGIDQNGARIPDGPVILSPDRTIAAFRREVIMKKPEIFKMACLKDIQNLFGYQEGTPFYAGFGNRITDALSYRYVGVPPSKIFTINSNSEVHMELLELAGYKSSYIYIADLVDHFFPPVIQGSGKLANAQETFTDLNYWREPLIDLNDLSEDDTQPTGSEMRSSSSNNDSSAASEARRLMTGSLNSGTIGSAKSDSSASKSKERLFISEHPEDSYNDDDAEDEYDYDDYDYDDYDEEEDLDGDLLDQESEFDEGSEAPLTQALIGNDSPTNAGNPRDRQIRMATEMVKNIQLQDLSKQG